MKHQIIRGLLILSLGSLFSGTARAQDDVTPADVTDLGVYHISSFSISEADGTLAFAISTIDPSTGLFSQNVWTTPRSGTSTQKITTYSDETIAIADDPFWNASGFVAYRVVRESAPPGASTVPGPEVAVATNDVSNTITPDGLHVDSFSWSPDEAGLVLLADQEGLTTGLYTINVTAGLAGAGLTRILDCAGCGDPEYAPNDDVIAYTLSDGIHLVNGDGSSDYLAIPGGRDPEWSPVTGLIAFSCASGNICVANEDGTGLMQVTHNEQGLFFSEPAWSPDEALIAMIGRPVLDSVSPGFLFVATPDGNAVTQFATDPDAAAPEWLPIETASEAEFASLGAFELYYLCDRPEGEHFCVFRGFNVPQGGCDATTCAGCCSQGVCFPGSVATACGLHGNECTVCAQGKICDLLGNCADPTECGISTCTNGCCDAQQRCHEPPSPEFCGFGGLTCMPPCGSDEVCNVDRGGCVQQNPATCTGCVGPRGCEPGDQDDACGHDGFTCETCQSPNHCTTNRECGLTGASGCTIDNCQNGCCRNGQCHQQSDSACGLGGAGCANCSDMGETCQKSVGTCNGPDAPCASASCGTGCCDPGTNACTSGSTNEACGSLDVCGPCPAQTTCMGDAISGFYCL